MFYFGIIELWDLNYENKNPSTPIQIWSMHQILGYCIKSGYDHFLLSCLQLKIPPCWNTCLIKCSSVGAGKSGGPSPGAGASS